MATYTFIPSSLTGGDGIQDASDAYADTSNTNSAIVTMSNGGASAYLGGFNVSLPSYDALTVTVKIKGRDIGANYPCYVTLMSASDGVTLSDTIPLTNSTTVYTFTLTASAETVVSYANTLCIQISPPSTGQQYAVVFGAEIIVDATLHSRNKVIYGNETLIDLTSDTATASDVVSGKTFHLASGLQATGAFSASAKTKTASLSSAERNISFTGLEKEPSWFVAILDGMSTRNSYPTPAFLFDGTACFALYCFSTPYNDAVTCNRRSNSDYTFTYSSGTLRLDINGSYFPAGSFPLYYL